jgi:predicted nucleic acid-binding protein
VIVVDSSAWIEFFRRTGSPVAVELRRLIASDDDIGITEIVFAEVLAGAASGPRIRELRSTLLAFPLLPLEGLADFEEAAVLYRSCRAAGETLRGLIDCLIAVPAIRADAEILHRDRDFDAIARHTALRIHVPSSG